MAINNNPTIQPQTITGIFTKYIAKTLPLAFDESMSYYECLCALLEYINTKVVPALDNNAEGLGELQEFYLELQNYVNNYFENLDVQEEINNKLDQMAESGQLTDIIAQYLGLAGMIAYDTLADMKEAENLVNGSKCRTLGYYSVNDGGGAYYKIRQVTNDDVVDDMFIIEVNDNNLVGELITDNLNIKQLGSNGIVTNDTKALKGFANSSVKTLIIPNGSYLLNDIVDLEDKELIGNGNPTITINGITTAREHTIHVSGSCYINGINFIQTVANTNIMGLFNSHDTIIENCGFKVDDVKCNGYFDLYTDNHNIKILNCNFDCISTEMEDNEKVNAIGGVWIRQYYNDYTSDNIFIENCVFSHQSKDEVIGIWNDKNPCLLSNVQLNNCIIKDKSGATNPHIITINANNSSINNCIIERYTDTYTGSTSIIHQAVSTSVPVEVTNCVINTNVKQSGGIFNTGKCLINNCVINDTSDETRLINEGKIMNSTINCNSFQNQYFPVTIENCELNMAAQTHSWLFRKTCTLLNNTFNFKSTNPTNIIYIVGSSDTGFTYFLKGNVFNYYNNEEKNLAHLHSTSGNKLYAYDNFYLGNITNEGTNTGVVANNLLSETLDTLTYIKTNNNFNINA